MRRRNSVQRDLSKRIQTTDHLKTAPCDGSRRAREARQFPGDDFYSCDKVSCVWSFVCSWVPARPPGQSCPVIQFLPRPCCAESTSEQTWRRLRIGNTPGATCVACVADADDSRSRTIDFVTVFVAAPSVDRRRVRPSPYNDDGDYTGYGRRDCDTSTVAAAILRATRSVKATNPRRISFPAQFSPRWAG